MKVKSRYPFKIGDVLIPAGEEGRLATLDEARLQFPTISENTKSDLLSVVFRDMEPCVVLKKQIELITL